MNAEMSISFLLSRKKNNIFSAEFYRVEKGEIPTEFEVYLKNKGENEKISFAKAMR